MFKALVIVVILAGPALQASDVAKAERVLVDRPDDPVANTTVGAFHAVNADWEKALPHLAKAKAPEILSGLEAEKKDDGNYLTWVEIADAWTKKLPKSGAVRDICVDRASYWYLKAWPQLDVVWQAKLHERLTRIYAPPLPGKSSGFPDGWSGPVDAFHKAMYASDRVHSGSNAVKLIPGRKAKNARLLFTPSVALVPGKRVEFSIWVLSDGTDSINDCVRFYMSDAERKLIGAPEKIITKDTPVWRKLTYEQECPEGAVRWNMEVVLFSKEGTVWVDDLSIKVDGKETLVNGGFEK